MIIQKEALIPLQQVPDRLRERFPALSFPGGQMVQEAADYLNVSPSDLFFNPKKDSAPFVYYKDVVFIELPEVLTVDELELTKMKMKIKQTHISLKRFVKQKEWKRLFLFMDPRILLPAYDELVNEIPEDQKEEVLQAIRRRLGTGR
ncbi:hypothetical protein [Domibacillus indicus]|uniref:hypothetical protein n=1 Tax=Domibacillus indicus TaxID=1437523 RepID=UPI000618299B|nr:hypothetical protein [Domibacillus indicus]